MPALDSYVAWLAGFVAEHGQEAPEDQRNIDLKAEHSLKVLAEARAIAAEVMAGDERLRRLTCLAALLHDVGRFPQYQRHRTFRDDESLNHGWLGSRTLRERGVLKGLPPADALLVLAVVHLHNRRAVPGHLPGDVRLAVQVVRDADKLDILRVFRDRFLRSTNGSAKVVLNLVDDPARYSPELLAPGGLPDYRRLRYRNDYVILLLSWAFDLNFGASRRAMLERGAVDEFLALLPGDAAVAEFGTRVRGELARP